MLQCSMGCMMSCRLLCELAIVVSCRKAHFDLRVTRVGLLVSFYLFVSKKESNLSAFTVVFWRPVKRLVGLEKM